MKKISTLLIIVTMLVISGCSDDRCGISPPTWVQGTWKGSSGTDYLVITSNDIITESRTANGSVDFSIELCESLAIGGQGLYEVDEIIESEDAYSISITLESAGSTFVDYRTFFVIDDNTIGFCIEDFPCNSYSELVRE